ncbi:uncharacterized protein N7484_010875 [Penicillium longicatenatum]|uniref:uncharacterized protein n=1 Tax=Penicillium longicatenatum TaxID=1561947 RepID=UPI0025497606|nr:uncharacterized protein N7484_010875 [Penicillium longicatenatum]KAJ5630775.1 hypothetical protein N7484_010875 [Penicillium longicatenatum]
MTTIPLRTRASTLRLRLQPPRLSSVTPRSLSTLTAGYLQQRGPQTKSTLVPHIYKTPRQFAFQNKTIHPRQYSTAPKPTADALIEELQDLYEIAKDEFEIATESTDGGTIYAASDRESARDALNDFCATYFLYTSRPDEEDTGVVLRSGEAMSGTRLRNAEVVTLSEGEEQGPVVDTTFDPANVEVTVREEVRRRIGQRVRELRSAVELLEERAHAE